MKQQPPDLIPEPPTPIITYSEGTGVPVKVFEPRFAEGYEGYYNNHDLARRRREIIEGHHGK